MKIVVATLFVLLACVAVAFVQACDDEKVTTNNVATSSKMKSENERMMEQKAATVDEIKSRMYDLSEKDIAKYRSMAMRARQAAERARTNPGPMSTTQKEREEQVSAKMQAVSPSTHYKSMGVRKEANVQRQQAESEMNLAQKVHTYLQVLEHQQNQMNNEAKSATVDEEMNPVLVDTEAITQHAKMAMESAKNLPSSFKKWKEHVKQKMAAAKANTHQEVSTKNNVQNNDIRVASSVNKYASPTHNDLVKEIEVEAKTAATTPRPYLMPLEDRSKMTKQAETMSSHEPKSYPLPAQKVWEDMVQARIEELKANPQKWEEMKNRVEKMELPYQYTRPYKPHRPYPRF